MLAHITCMTLLFMQVFCWLCQPTMEHFCRSKYGGRAGPENSETQCENLTKVLCSLHNDFFFFLKNIA
ncbi:hypothetical protein RchiOBHm_Chr4g0410531 [Rosa chinensis]|uniref:Secreted protein n=1 Tax=Rosa chinensis TaxID=74649 RepID=A0A2P6QVD0_ROSCH|nr:hypothetical protein RchiOBHm_Chr4g0410531 [Rosa chinensis]